QPGTIIAGPARAGLAMLTRGRTGRPARPVPLAAAVRTGPAAPLAVTWFGHSSALIEVDGHRVLADPMWGDRASPSGRVGPHRLHPPPMPLADLPPVDAVVISHDHYDHLDLPTVRALTRLTRAPFVVPLGVGAHLRRWGVPASRVLDLDWDGSATLPGAAGPLTITCVEARHFSGRGLVRNTTQWSSWALSGPHHRVFFGGDTGLHDALGGIGDRLGPFDLTLLPIGAYSDLWPDIHMTPEQAVAAHAALGGRLLVPIHWATFDLGFHTWSEPVERLRRAAAAAGVRLALPRPGQRVDATAPHAEADWWSPVAFATDSAPPRPSGDSGRMNLRPASTMRRALLYYRGR
ncbi:MBL fold metallo-hydrolase, partial [Pseudonocardia lacus]|uniref:MBL fold metallo-hydrolase n=1 Tax=Pseudonocardia lacus TaxID=2835865 RepID=UPI001BDD1F10